MKTILEVDLKGSAGSTIAEIVSFSKDVIIIPSDWENYPPDKEEIYRIHLKFKNGTEDEIEFTRHILGIREESCFGEEILIYEKPMKTQEL